VALVARAREAPVATGRTVSVVPRARSRVRVAAETWMSCNRS
jgi:hypothetical protein